MSDFQEKMTDPICGQKLKNVFVKNLLV